MSKIDLTKFAAAAPAKEKSADKKLFEGVTTESLMRAGQVRSHSMKLSEIEEFEDNPRLEYKEEDQALLEESIQENGITEEIGVFHIVDGDRYIICDGHRRKKAMEKVLGKDEAVEVIVRKQFAKYDAEARTELLRVGLSTSSTKKNLSTYEEVEAVAKYLKNLDEAFPDEPPHKITQKRVYGSLFTKEKAMTIGRVLETLTPEQRKALKDADVPMKRARELSELIPKVDKETADQLTDLTGKGVIESKDDMKKVMDTRMEVAEAIPEDLPNRAEVVASVTEEKVRQEKEENAQLERIPKDPKDKSKQDFKKHCKSISRTVAVINPSEYADDDKREILREAFQLYKLLEEFLKDNGADPTEKTEKS